MCSYLCIYTSEIHASTVAVLTRVVGEVARVTSCYSPQQKYTLPGRRAHRQNRVISWLCAPGTLETELPTCFHIERAEPSKAMPLTSYRDAEGHTYPQLFTCRRLSQDALL